MARTGEQWQSHLDRVGRIVPLPLLAVATFLAWQSAITGYGTWTQFEYGLIVVAASAAWSLVITLWMPGRPVPQRVLGYAVHTLLTAGLVVLNPWFALFGWVGYVIADELLPPRAVVYGFGATALVVACAEAGGVTTLHGVGLVVYAVIVLANFGLVVTIFTATQRVFEQNRKLEAAIAENEGLHAQLLTQAREAGVLDERQRLAGEIHDTLAQTFTGIVTQLEAAAQARHVGRTWSHHLEQAQALARSGLTEARRSVRALRPEQLEHASLDQAVGELARSWAETTRLTAHVETSGDPRPIGCDAEAALFRVAQEALTNAGKHADASKVWITLTYLGDVLLLDVRDDGTGFEPEVTSGGYGLRSMRARVERVGGTFTVESARGEGTAISASVPVGAA